VLTVCRFWGIFWIDASTNEMAEEGFMSIARTCKQEEHIESVKEWLSSKEHWLLIIDNADDPNLDISRFFPLGTKGTVLITTRNPDFQRYASVGSCRVDEMSPGDAATLLLKSAALPNIQDREREAAEQIVKTLGYLALAIFQAGAAIRQRLVGLDGFCELYSKRKKELLESGRPESSIDYQRSVYTTWEISIRMIEDMKEEHAVLALELLRHFSFMHFDCIFEGIFESACNNVGLLPENSNFSKTLMIQMIPSGWNQLLMGKALGLLVAFSLITIDEYRRISMHPLVHEWSRARMSEEERLKAWKTSVLTLSMATTFDNWLLNLQQRRLLLPHIDAILSHGEDELFSDGNDLEDRLGAASKFAMAYRENHRVNSKILSTKALKCVERKFPEHRSYAMQEVAQDLESTGSYKEALEIRQELLKRARAQDGASAGSIVAAAVRVAGNHTSLGFHQEAIDLCEDTIEEFEGVLSEGSPYMFNVWEVLGEATFQNKKPKEARVFLEKALECYSKRELPDQNFYGVEVLRRLAILYCDLELPKKARAAQHQYIAQMKKTYGVDDPRTVLAVAKYKEFETPGTLSILNSLQRRARGIAPTREAFERHRSMQGQTHVETLLCMSQLAWDYYQCGAFEKAIVLQEELVKLNTQKWGKDHGNTIHALKNLTQMRKKAAIRKDFYWWLPKKGFLQKDWLRV
jgi:tetratricopeptide (TPR) repeat protein